MLDSTKNLGVDMVYKGPTSKKDSIAGRKFEEPTSQKFDSPNFWWPVVSTKQPMGLNSTLATLIPTATFRTQACKTLGFQKSRVSPHILPISHFCQFVTWPQNFQLNTQLLPSTCRQSNASAVAIPHKFLPLEIGFSTFHTIGGTPMIGFSNKCSKWNHLPYLIGVCSNLIYP